MSMYKVVDPKGNEAIVEVEQYHRGKVRIIGEIKPRQNVSSRSKRFDLFPVLSFPQLKLKQSMIQ